MPGVLEIIVVEDHRLLRDELVDYLSSPDWHVRGVSSGRELDVAMTETPADVLVLDLNLPQEDGISITRRIRKAFPEIGIVMLTARGDQADRALGYGSGADVYLTKPTHVGELESVLSCETDGERILKIHAQRNPDKLARIAAAFLQKSAGRPSQVG